MFAAATWGMAAKAFRRYDTAHGSTARLLVVSKYLTCRADGVRIYTVGAEREERSKLLCVMPITIFAASISCTESANSFRTKRKTPFRASTSQP